MNRAFCDQVYATIRFTVVEVMGEDGGNQIVPVGRSRSRWLWMAFLDCRDWFAQLAGIGRCSELGLVCLRASWAILWLPFWQMWPDDCLPAWASDPAMVMASSVPPSSFRLGRRADAAFDGSSDRTQFLQMAVLTSGLSGSFRGLFRTAQIPCSQDEYSTTSRYLQEPHPPRRVSASRKMVAYGIAGC